MFVTIFSLADSSIETFMAPLPPVHNLFPSTAAVYSLLEAQLAKLPRLPVADLYRKVVDQALTLETPFQAIDLDGDGYTDDLVGSAKLEIELETHPFEKKITYYTNVIFVMNHTPDNRIQTQLLNAEGEPLSTSLRAAMGSWVYPADYVSGKEKYLIGNFLPGSNGIPDQAQEILFFDHPHIPLSLGLFQLFNQS